MSHELRAGPEQGPLASLRAIVFDVDGTLAETERNGHRVAYDAAFADLGLPWRWDPATYGRWLAIAGGKERLRAYIEAEQPAYARADLDALVARVHDAKSGHFTRLAASLTLRPGVERLVQEAAAAGVAVAIATTASLAAVAALLEAHPVLAAAVETIGAGDVVARKKPDGAVYAWVLAQLELVPAQAVAVEDSAVGLQAAHAAGIATLVTPSDYTANDDFTAARAVVSNLGEPDAPARVLRGPALPRGHVDLAYVAGLLHYGAGGDVASTAENVSRMR